jgi:hypothetical protein
MKYIKSFNESLRAKELADSILEDIKDILLEINDIGYYSNAYILYSCHTFFDIQIDISKSKEALDEYIDSSDPIEEIDIEEIWEVLERILDYSKLNKLKESHYDINDVSVKTYVLNNINEISTYNLKKLNIFLSFNI